MDPLVWTALEFVLICYGILLVISLLVALMIVAVRWAVAPRGEKPKEAKLQS